MYNPLKLKKSYVSEADLFLRELEKSFPPSPAQELEIKKAKKISELRDHATDSTAQLFESDDEGRF